MADVCGEEASAQKIYNYADHETKCLVATWADEETTWNTMTIIGDG